MKYLQNKENTDGTFSFNAYVVEFHERLRNMDTQSQARSQLGKEISRERSKSKQRKQDCGKPRHMKIELMDKRACGG
jgi:hypothetical protein